MEKLFAWKIVLNFSEDVGHAKSSLLLKDDVVFISVFWSLSLGCFGRLLHTFVADSNQVERCPVYLFFLGLVFFWIRGWDQVLEACGGVVEMPFQVEEGKEMGKRRMGPLSFWW